METGHVVASDGTRLRVRSWRPTGEARASVSIVHGLSEHADRYDETARTLAARGFACHAVDLRGHGDSPGLRVHVDSFDEYVADVAGLRAHAREAHPGAPAFLLGHSMGALVALLSALRQPDGLRGAVLTSPFLAAHPEVRPGRFRRALARVLVRLAPRLQVPSGVPPERVSRDPAVVDAYRRDPRISRTVSAGWFHAARAAQDEARRGAGAWRVPALVVSAGDDRLVDLAAVRAWVAATPPGLVELDVRPGLFHEVLNEPEREAVVARVASWLEARVR